MTESAKDEQNKQADKPTDKDKSAESRSTESKPKLDEAHYADNEFPIDQAVTHADALIGQSSWVTRAALQSAGLGDFATVEQMRDAVDRFLALPAN